MRTLTDLLRALLQCRLSVVLDDSVIRLSNAVERWSEVEESIAELSDGSNPPSDLALKITGALSEAKQMAREWNGDFDSAPEGTLGGHCQFCLMKNHCPTYQLQ
jgi:hypothetical protein